MYVELRQDEVEDNENEQGDGCKTVVKEELADIDKREVDDKKGKEMVEENSEEKKELDDEKNEELQKIKLLCFEQGLVRKIETLKMKQNDLHVVDEKEDQEELEDDEVEQDEDEEVKDAKTEQQNMGE